MNSKVITRFEFPELIEKESPVVEVKEEIIVSDTTLENKLPLSHDFAEQNIMSEIGYNIQSNKEIEKVENINIIKLSKDELDILIAKAKSDGINDYIANLQPTNNNQDNALERINEIIVGIKERFEIEFDGLLDKIVQLSYAIANKVIDLSSLQIPKHEFVKIIKKRIEELDFQPAFSLEVSDEDIASILRQNGIEVSINNDMLVGDYKIIWCNGFLERNTSEISAKVEEILIDQINKI